MLPPGQFFQVAYVVNDLHAAMRYWHEVHGAGPFFFIDEIAFGTDIYSHRGEPQPLTIGFANGMLGPIQLELIVQHDDRPSAYRDVYARGQEGFHHMALRADDFDATRARYAERYEIAQELYSPDMSVCYFDARGDAHCMIEVVKVGEAGAKMTQAMADAAIGWDGGDPFRPLPYTGV